MWCNLKKTSLPDTCAAVHSAGFGNFEVMLAALFGKQTPKYVGGRSSDQEAQDAAVLYSFVANQTVPSKSVCSHAALFGMVASLKA